MPVYRQSNPRCAASEFAFTHVQLVAATVITISITTDTHVRSTEYMYRAHHALPFIINADIGFLVYKFIISSMTTNLVMDRRSLDM